MKSVKIETMKKCLEQIKGKHKLLPANWLQKSKNSHHLIIVVDKEKMCNEVQGAHQSLRTK